MRTMIVVALVLSACAPRIESSTPAMVEVVGFDAQSIASLAQQHCRQHGRDAAARMNEQAGFLMIRTFECVSANR